MNIPYCLFPVLVASCSIAVLSGCRSAPPPTPQEERIKEFQVKLTTGGQENAGAVAKLALIVECEQCPPPTRQVYELGKATYEPGQTRTFEIKTHETIPWIDRDRLTLSISTASEDGYLPSHIWIAAISDKGERFALRNTGWTNKMFSVETDDPEAVPPVVCAPEWVVPHEE